MKVFNLFVVIVTLFISGHSYAGSSTRELSPNKGNRAIQTQRLTTEEKNHLIYMREEEKLARDIYLTLADYFDSNIFNNIASAEQRHMDSVKRLLNKFGLLDPVADDENEIGIFTNPEFAQIYQNRTKTDVTIKEAIETGIFIEETDILDLQKAIAETNNIDILNTYENLLRGSRNHLRAFVRRLESIGIVYKATILNQSVADTIVNSPMERGASKRSGKGKKGRR